MSLHLLKSRPWDDQVCYAVVISGERWMVDYTDCLGPKYEEICPKCKNEMRHHAKMSNTESELKNARVRCPTDRLMRLNGTFAEGIL